MYIIANHEFDDEKYMNLDFVKNDFEKTTEVFEKYGEFDKVVPMVNMVSHELKLLLEEGFADLTKDDELFVYFSGHGAMVRDKLYLISKNTKESRIVSSSIEAHFIVELLSDCKSKIKALILDCCYSAAFFYSLTKSGSATINTETIKRINDNHFSNAKGLYIITSSSAVDVSHLILQTVLNSYNTCLYL